MVALGEVINPEIVERINSIASATNTENTEKDTRRENKLKPYRELLDKQPILREKIVTSFSGLQSMPAIHITTSGFKTEEKVTPSGFVENITEQGFKSKDTNVGIFMERDGVRHPADPEVFCNSPEKIFKGIRNAYKTLLPSWGTHQQKYFRTTI